MTYYDACSFSQKDFKIFQDLFFSTCINCENESSSINILGSMAKHAQGRLFAFVRRKMLFLFHRLSFHTSKKFLDIFIELRNFSNVVNKRPVNFTSSIGDIIQYCIREQK